ncbi:MAG: NAD(P)/FAD-dependent oxidoreductase [Alphaproteobacteria bacterium]
MQNFDVIILGAGAAGLMCAARAARRGRRVIVLDHARKPGEKILISGGGRCNFTNRHLSPANFLSDNPHFCISALKRYTQYDFIDLVERYGIAYHERDHGQLFCDTSARDIVAMLLDEARDATVQTSTNVQSVERTEGDGPRFRVATDRGNYGADAVVVATGGPAIPQMGASGFAYDIARQFGLNVIEPRAGLVPLTFDDVTMGQLQGLSGVSLDARAELGKARFDEALLFTHQGFSGPVILQISSYWRDGDTLSIDLLPGVDALDTLKAAKRDQPRKEVQTVLSSFLPRSLALRLAEMTGCNGRMAEISDKALARVAAQINNWRVTPSGSQGLRKAEVTLGGVDTRELSSKTMEANAVPGLYFIGESVDVTGHLGGFNFQWAWASGHACGEAV